MQIYILEPNTVIGNRWTWNTFYWTELKLSISEVRCWFDTWCIRHWLPIFSLLQWNTRSALLVFPELYNHWYEVPHVQLLSPPAQSTEWKVCNQRLGKKGWEKAWNYWTISRNDSATLTHTSLRDWGQQKQASIFLKQYWSIYLQLMNLPTPSISKGQGRKIHYQNIPPRTAEEDMVRFFWNCPPLIKPREKMCILIQKGTCKSAMPNFCPRSERGNVMLQGILKKRRKQNMKKGI